MRLSRLFAMAATVLFAGCYSPYHADRGALLGGLGGAGVGALVGHAVGNTGAGAAIGAGVGALSGAAIGSGMDEVEARNRAMIEQQMQRPLAQGATTVEEVVAMTRAGVAEDLIANHVRANGLARPLAAADLIYLGQQNVSPNVIRAMQEPRQVQAAPVVMQPAGPPPVVVEEYYYQTPYWYPPPPPYHYCRPRPRVGVGFSVHN